MYHIMSNKFSPEVNDKCMTNHNIQESYIMASYYTHYVNRKYILNISLIAK